MEKEYFTMSLNELYLLSLLEMPYCFLCDTFMKKYGKVNIELTNDISAQTTNLVRRNNLFTHLINRNTLSYYGKYLFTMTSNGCNKPPEYIYCNILEQLLLYTKIIQELCYQNSTINEIKTICKSINTICHQLNTLYENPSASKNSIITKPVTELYDCYVVVLQKLLLSAKEHSLLPFISKNSLSCNEKGNIVKKIYEILRF